MLWLPLALLHTAPAAVPARPLAALVRQAGNNSSTTSSSGSGSSSASSSSGSNSSTTSSSSSSSGSGSGSSGSDSGSSSSGSSSSASSSGTSSAASGSSTGGTTGTQIGNQPGDQDQDTVGVPSRCNTSDDCPLNFVCSDHKCKPVSQKEPQGGCASAPGLGLAAAIVALSAVLLRRRRLRA